MDFPLLIRQRLRELGTEQRDLAAAAQVTESYISQLLTGKKAPPAPERTDIYDRMETFLRLPAGKLATLADLVRTNALKRKLADPPAPLFKEVRELILRKVAPGKAQPMSIAGLCGVVLVELYMAEWRRIPFTCSYEPSRQFVGQTLLIGIAAFVGFTTIGSRLALYSISHPAGWLAVMAILGAIALYLRRQRLWMSQRATLMFEDILPNEVEPLRLSEY